MPQSVIVRVTRWISCRTEVSRPPLCGSVPLRDVAVEIFRDRDLGRQRAPGFRHLDVLLLEDHLAAVVGDLGRACSHSIWSNGVTAGPLKTRSKRSPAVFFFGVRWVRCSANLAPFLSDAGVIPGLSWIMVLGGVEVVNCS